MTTVAHVPAWQKLGLKLKKPQQDTTSQSAPVVQNGKNVNEGHSKKRSLDAHDNDESHWASQKLPKRSKTDHSTRELILNGVTGLNKLPAKRTVQDDGDFDRSQGQKRKSVSFGPEVKTDDGDSVRFFKKKKLKRDEVASDDSGASSLQPRDASEVDVQAGSQGKVKKKKKKKKKAKQKQTQTDSAESKETVKVKNTLTDGQTPSHLTYLSTYHSARSDWKFSKLQQNTLLKKLYDIDEIPSSYDTAILSYLEGLQGDNARNRLRERALEIRQSDEEWLDESSKEESKDQQDTKERMASPTDPDRARRRKEDYEGCLAQLRSTLREKAYEREEKEWERCGEKEAWEQRWRKRKRAEVVLWCVGESTPTPPPPPSPAAKPVVPSHIHPSRLQQQQHQHEDVEDMPNNNWMWGRDARRIDSTVAGKSGKKVTFGDDGVAVKSETGATALKQAQSTIGGGGGANGGTAAAVGGKKKRKRRGKKRTGVPDDDDDSSSSSDSDGGVQVKKDVAVPKMANGTKVKGKPVKGAGSDSSSSSSSDDSSSDSSSSGSSDDSSDDSDESD